MRIVYLNPSGQTGGAEVALLDILASLKEAEPQWELHLIVPDEGVLTAKAKALGVLTNVLPFPASLARLGDSSAGGPAGNEIGHAELLRKLFFAGPGISSYAVKLRTMLRQLGPDVLHTNGFKMHLLAALSKPGKVPLVWHLHDYVRARPFMSTLMKLLRARCSIALANSNSVRRDFEALCGDDLPVQTIYNAVDTAVFSSCGASVDLDSLSGFPSSNGRIVKVGMLATLARWKGHETFLRAISLLPPDLPLRGYIVGDAIYQTDGSQYSVEELKAVAQKLGIADRVAFTGFVEEPAPIMRALDIVVHASTEPEPFGLVIAEAMACGRAVIVSETGGAAELIEDGMNALAHQPGDAAQLAQRIKELATDAQLRARLGAAGRVTAEQRFDRARLAAELIPIYRSRTVGVGSQKSEVRSQKSEVRSQRGEISGLRAEVRSQTDANSCGERVAGLSKSVR
jgi:glycosyltransferase involved in cell wall biosynthesis